ncbi:MAG: NAD(P)-dependent oxidoreductase [Oligoflexales bacterium]
MRIGFIGLGNVGYKLANSLLEEGFELIIHDLEKKKADPFIAKGAKWAKSPAELSLEAEGIITCLPSPGVVREVMEGELGVLSSITSGKIWIEMSTTDDQEMKRIANRVKEKGANVIEAPVSGGCHRAATGQISIFVGGDREAFEKALPVLSCIGYKILHVGPIGSASILKVVTNFLASTHLVALGEALMVCKKAGIDLKKAFEGIKISSGNSFVHETESQVIMNGSYNINFTLDLVCKDVGLFKNLSETYGVPTEISKKIFDIFEEGRKEFGDRAWSSMIVKRIENHCKTNLRADGFPIELEDHSKRQKGYEIITD